MTLTPYTLWSTVRPDHAWRRQSTEDVADYVLHGRCTHLPPSPSKTVRIFLSSTFTDTYTERNLLIKDVYPKLQKLCREKYDLDFQVRGLLLRNNVKKCGLDF